MPLRHHTLVAYLQERGIPTQIAAEHCKQIHYSCRGNRYYAVGFANESGGWELRNKYFKGCIAPKDISLRRIRDGPTTDVAVFEGFIDYLSALTLDVIMNMDAIILNSVSNVGKAVQHLRDYSTIHCFLDNDEAGQRALSMLTEQHGNVIDYSRKTRTYFNTEELQKELVNMECDFYRGTWQERDSIKENIRWREQHYGIDKTFLHFYPTEE